VCGGRHHQWRRRRKSVNDLERCRIEGEVLAAPQKNAKAGSRFALRALDLEHDILVRGVAMPSTH
jgi:hypothetical protein